MMPRPAVHTHFIQHCGNNLKERERASSTCLSLFKHAEKTSSALQETQIPSMHQVSAVQSISLSSAAAVAVIPPHKWIHSLCYLSKTQGKFTGSRLFSFQMITHLFWSRSCCSGVKDSQTSADQSCCETDSRSTGVRCITSATLWTHACTALQSCLVVFPTILSMLAFKKYFFTLLKCISSRIMSTCIFTWAK